MLIFKEKLDGKMDAVIIGFAGVVVVINPGELKFVIILIFRFYPLYSYQ